ncbi:MAG TPA: glycosyltransferase [Candidatus Binatia bacterium]|nr:glycosyltransferase [Candidatus Binatia bacterium]
MLQQENSASATTPAPTVLVCPSWWYPNRNAPFSGLFVRRQALAIAALCPTAVLFVTPDPSLAGQREIVRTVEDGLLTVRVYFRPAAASHGQALLNTLRFIAAAAAGRRALPVPFQSPDLVQVQITPPVGLILFLRWFLGRTPLIFSEHWSKYLQPPDRKHPLRRWFIHCFCRRGAAVTAVSETLARGMRAHGLRARRWQVIGNAVDPETFFPEPAKKPGETVSILHVSSQNEMKHIAGIIRAMAVLLRRRPNCRLQIIGSGPARAGCEELARAEGLFGNAVLFLDPLPERELAAVMRRGDILVLFSAFETFACVAAEALASGLAVVSTPTAVAEYLPEASGILVPFADEGALAVALEKMIDRPPTFVSSAGRRVVSERFAPREIGRHFFDLFHEVLGERKP